MAQTVYIETSIVSYLAARPSRDVMVAAVYNVDYLLTWNCRHLGNAATRPVLRAICGGAGYRCPESCTPPQLTGQDDDDVPR